MESVTKPGPKTSATSPRGNEAYLAIRCHSETRHNGVPPVQREEARRIVHAEAEDSSRAMRAASNTSFPDRPEIDDCLRRFGKRFAPLQLQSGRLVRSREVDLRRGEASSQAGKQERVKGCVRVRLAEQNASTQQRQAVCGTCQPPTRVHSSVVSSRVRSNGDRLNISVKSAPLRMRSRTQMRSRKQNQERETAEEASGRAKAGKRGEIEQAKMRR